MRLALALLLVPTLAHAAIDGEGVNKRLVAVRTAKPPAIDGSLDDAVWSAAPPDDQFTQFQPEEGKPPTERTEVRVLFDDENVYFSVRCEESGGVSSRLTRRDRDIETDWLVISIDSRHDHSSARFFQLSPAGVQVDGEMFADTEMSYEWDGVWRGATSVDDHGWSGEWAIPFSMLRFPDVRDQVWGIQILRNVSSKQQWMGWTWWPSRVQGQVSRWGHLVGVTGIRPRRTVELRPYIVGRVRGRSPDGGMPLRGDVDPSAEVGIDAKVGLTSSLTLDATLNPDFGQVEADVLVLNLTNFETFFPEKRPFFLEGREVFETPLTLFYPRRIGRPPVDASLGDMAVGKSGEPLRLTSGSEALPIWVATKVAGRIGDRLGLGVMGALTGPQVVDAVDVTGEGRELELAPARSYGVLRARLDLAGNAHIGAVVTAVDRLGGEVYRAASNHDAYTQAIDGRWQSPQGGLRLQGQLALSERVGGTAYRQTDGRPCPEGAGDPTCLPITRPDGTRLAPGDVGFGGFAGFHFSSERFFSDATYQALTPKLDLNDAGFLPDFNTHAFSVRNGIINRRPHGIFNKTIFYPAGDLSLSWDGRVVQKAVVGMDSEATFKNLWFSSPQVFFSLPRTYNDFETFDGAHFERPANVDLNWVIQSNKSAAFWGSVRGLYRKDLNADGWYAGVESSFNWQALSNLELALEPSAGFDQNAIRFFDCATDGGQACVVESGARHYHFADLDSRFVSAVFRGTYTFIPTLSLQAYAQLFLAEGDYARFRDVDTMGASPKIRLDDLRPSSFTAEDAGFATTSLNVNVVVRWEPLPGSTIFAVYTRAQEAPRYGLRGFGSGASEDVFLLKLVYFAS